MHRVINIFSLRMNMRDFSLRFLRGDMRCENFIRDEECIAVFLECGGSENYVLGVDLC